MSKNQGSDAALEISCAVATLRRAAKQIGAYFGVPPLDILQSATDRIAELKKERPPAEWETIPFQNRLVHMAIIYWTEQSNAFTALIEQIAPQLPDERERSNFIFHAIQAAHDEVLPYMLAAYRSCGLRGAPVVLSTDSLLTSARLIGWLMNRFPLQPTFVTN